MDSFSLFNFVSFLPGPVAPEDVEVPAEFETSGGSGSNQCVIA
jgi:hypothetical protein